MISLEHAMSVVDADQARAIASAAVAARFKDIAWTEHAARHPATDGSDSPEVEAETTRILKEKWDAEECLRAAIDEAVGLGKTEPPAAAEATGDDEILF